MFAALKHTPALDPDPILSRNPSLCCGQVPVVKDLPGMPARVSGARLVAEGEREGWEGALVPREVTVRWHIHAPSHGPLAGAADLFWGVSVLLAWCVPSTHPVL